MNITDVRIRKIDSDSNIKASVCVTLEDVFVVHDIKVIEGDKGLFVAMPSRKFTDGQYRDIAHPLNQEFRSYMQDTILTKYNEVNNG